MTRQVFALFVGIDQYPSPVPQLSGCANDVRATRGVIAGLVGDRLHSKVLLDQQATRAAVISGFRAHLAQAGPGDIALFVYSGHGAQEDTPETYWAGEPDHRNETVVCFDSRTPGQRDLADKELKTLVADAGAGGAEVVAILDCCHSGSGIRDIAPRPGQAIREADPDPRPRNLDSYAVKPWVAGDPEGKWLLLAACDPSQTAKEQIVGTERRGVFSASLQQALLASQGRLTYQDLLAITSTKVRDLAMDQNPQLENSVSTNVSQSFLGDAISDSPYQLTHGNAGWYVDAGAVRGIQTPGNGDFTRFAVYPPDTDLTSPASTAPIRLTRATVRVVETDRSLVDIDPVVLDKNLRYPAALLTWPLPPMPVFPSDSGGAAAVIHTAINDLGPSGEISVGDASSEYTISAGARGFEIRRTGDRRLLTTPVDDLSSAGAQTVVEHLIRIARWRRLRDLTNPSSTLHPSDLQLTITPTDGAQSDNDPVQVTYGQNDQAPSVRIELTNHSSKPLYVAMMGLSAQFGVRTLLDGSWCELLKAGDSISAFAGQPVPMEISDNLRSAGVTEVIDVVKVIASADMFDARALRQSELQDPPPTDNLPRTVSNNPIDPLVRRVADRAFGEPPAHMARAHWASTSGSILTRRPRPGIPVEAGGTDIGDGLTIIAPAGVSLSARVIDADSVTRDIGNHTIPVLLREATVQIPLASTRDLGQDNSVLELSIDPSASPGVSPENPLLVTIPAQIDADESIIAVAFDGVDWMVVGRVRTRQANGVEMAIGNLPPQIIPGQRDLWGSVKIMFRKLVGKPLGLPYTWPRLAVATVDPAGKAVYENDVAAQLRTAKRVLLYVHGIIGDTRGMVEHGHANGIDAQYDAVLTFDYENINTRIEDNAISLGARLHNAGLTPAHHLDVVAHSMGGLVSRWYVEHESGNVFVDRLVMCGTPNQGSPWPKMEDWATATLSAGLNALTSVVGWPATVLGGLVRLIEKSDNALDEMADSSQFIADLAKLPDPAIPYRLITGNRSVALNARVTGLFKKLKFKATNTAIDLLFQEKPNDIAVSVVSATGVPAPRAQLPTVTEVDCDHMTYFSSDSGTKALLDALT